MANPLLSSIKESLAITDQFCKTTHSIISETLIKKIERSLILRRYDLSLFPAWFVPSVTVHRTLRSCRNMQARTQSPASSPTLWKGTVHHRAKPMLPYATRTEPGESDLPGYPRWIVTVKSFRLTNLTAQLQNFQLEEVPYWN